MKPRTILPCMMLSLFLAAGCDDTSSSTNNVNNVNNILNFVRLVRGGATWDASVLAPATCGNAACDDGETAANCPQDCSGTGGDCGNGTCDPGETAQSCPQDCSEGPTACESNTDCQAPGACPIEAAVGCTCEPTPMGYDACIPNCDTAADCPPGPGGASLTCNAEGLCVPAQ